MSTLDLCINRDNSPLAQWKSYWSSGTCKNYFKGLLFTTAERPDGTIGPVYNDVLKSTISGYFNTIFTKYNGGNFGVNISEVGDPNYDDMQELLFDVCRKDLPGICDTYFHDFCLRKTREEIASKKHLIQACGCHSPPLSVGSNTFRKECDPLCHAPGAIKLFDGVDSYKQCSNTICVIDDVTVTASKTDVDKFTINQICACPNNDCVCIVSDINISSEIQSEINVSCGNNVVCYKDGKISDCKTTDGTGTGTGPAAGTRTVTKVPTWVYIGIGIIAVLLVIVLAMKLS